MILFGYLDILDSSFYFLMSLRDNVKLHVVHVMFLLDSAAVNKKVGV